MNIRKIWKTLSAMSVALGISALALTGCGLGDNAQQGDSSGNGAKSGDGQAKQYVVATRGTFRPFTYTDESGNLTGYDVEILREIESRNPDLHFDFKLMGVDAAFLAMESNQVDIIANQIVANPKRADKCVFTKEVNNYTSRRLAVRGETNDIQSIDDLQGRKVAVTSNSEVARQLQEYNETAATPIDLLYTDKGSSETLNLVVTGRADATPVYEVTITDSAKVLGLDVKAVGPVIASDPTCYALRKDADGQALADRLDATLHAMHEDGTMKALSEKFLGKDYTVPQK